MSRRGVLYTSSVLERGLTQPCEFLDRPSRPRALLAHLAIAHNALHAYGERGERASPSLPVPHLDMLIGVHVHNHQVSVAQLRDEIAGLEEDNRVLADAAGWELCEGSEVCMCAHVRHGVAGTRFQALVLDLVLCLGIFCRRLTDYLYTE